jgi:hypothetical protein
VLLGDVAAAKRRNNLGCVSGGGVHGYLPIRCLEYLALGRNLEVRKVTGQDRSENGVAPTMGTAGAINKGAAPAGG